jgi:hypothetical protein
MSEKEMTHKDNTEDIHAALIASYGDVEEALTWCINAISLDEGDTLQEHVQLY